MEKTRISQALVDYNHYKDIELNTIHSFRYTHTNNNSLFNVLLSYDCGYKTKKYFYEESRTKTYFFGIQKEIMNYNRTTALKVKGSSGFTCFTDWLDDFKSTYNYNNPKYIVKLNVIKCVIEFSKFDGDKDCYLSMYYKDDLLFRKVPLKTYNYYWKTSKFIKDNINSFLECDNDEVNK